MQIIFKNFKVSTIIGVYSEERLKETKLSISLKIDFDAKQAALSDKLQDTIDYDKLAEILNNSAKHKYYLIEALSKKIIDDIVNNFLQINNLEVEIVKPNIVLQADSVSIKEFYKRP